jgi:beta-lactam-binding protein with PASTA domain
MADVSPPSKQSRVPVWVPWTVAGVVVLVVAGALWWLTAGGQVVVPSVIGEDQTVATQQLQSAGLRLGDVSAEETDAPEGTVISQDPAAGDEVDESAAVDLVVSAGVAKTEVPELIGLTRSEAAKALADAGLDSTETVEYDSLVARGSVIDQVPAAGVKVVQGSTVGLLMSLGKRPASDITVPTVTGMTQNEAQTTLRDAGLAAYFVLENDDTVPAGSVVEQAPAAGKKVAPSTMVLVAVSIGPAAPSAVTVPDVVGEQKSAAQSALRALGLKNRVLEIYSDKPAGQVVEQEPAGRAKVAPGATIGLLVSAGPAPTKPPAEPPTYPDPPPGEGEAPLYPDMDTVKVPDVVGLDAEEALTVLLDAGLQPIAIPTPREDYAEGAVFEQVPEAGEYVYKGYSIMVLVATGSPDDGGSKEETAAP